MAVGSLRASGLMAARTRRVGDTADMYPAQLGTGGTQTTFTGNGTIGNAGIWYDVRTWTANGSIVVNKPGWVDLMVLGGGGNANGSSGGGSGGIKFGAFYLSVVGTYNITVGGVGGDSFIYLPSTATFLRGGAGNNGMPYGSTNWNSNSGGGSGSAEGGNNWGGGQGWSTGSGVPYDITGTSVIYGRNDGTGYGAGGGPNQGGVQGLVVIRVGVNG